MSYNVCTRLQPLRRPNPQGTRDLELCLRSSAPPEKLLLYPVLVMRYLDVNPWHVPLSAPDAPGYDSGQLPGATDLADKGSAAVALEGEESGEDQ